ncbi:hypothetical protein [Streptomyces jumonjinensis]|uniref:hypothetical protein n=1 Tax=Streptomyces jumonjinensis TaxID=1945 RepID=UPI00379F4652
MNGMPRPGRFTGAGGSASADAFADGPRAPGRLAPAVPPARFEGSAEEPDAPDDPDGDAVGAETEADGERAAGPGPPPRVSWASVPSRPDPVSAIRSKATRTIRAMTVVSTHGGGIGGTAAITDGGSARAFARNLGAAGDGARVRVGVGI